MDKKVIAALIVAGIAAGALWWSTKQADEQRAQQHARASQAWADLSRCLIGETLQEGETLEQRTRSIALAGAPADWPGRCAAHATALYGALEQGHPLRDALVDQLGCNNACSIDEVGPPFAALREANAEKPVAVVASTVEAPPQLDSALLSARNLPSLDKGELQTPAQDCSMQWPGAPIPKPPAPEPTKQTTKGVTDFGVIGLLDKPEDNPPSGWGLPKDMASRAKTKAMFGDNQEQESDSEPAVRPPLPFSSLVCDGTTGILTWRAGNTVHQRRCKSDDQCVDQKVALPALKIKAWWLATALRDHTLIVWRSDDGALRLRAGKLDALPSKPDVIVMDSERFGGPSTNQMRAITTRQDARFVFQDGANRRGFVVDADGKYAPLTSLEATE